MESIAKPHLREQVRTVMRLHHYRVRTGKSYWIRNFICFHQLRRSQELGAAEVNSFFT
ncbi:phage integrase N-terminal SAM-like domain-containing protein [Aeromonas hydrophila]|uniref:phage integrase N-terminal SAM-like domain-containing protein n=1 Tax=Aeromonas hydrophila TaxID=644 RepID=UPI0038D13CE7